MPSLVSNQVCTHFHCTKMSMYENDLYQSYPCHMYYLNCDGEAWPKEEGHPPQTPHHSQTSDDRISQGTNLWNSEHSEEL